MKLAALPILVAVLLPTSAHAEEADSSNDPEEEVLPSPEERYELGRANPISDDPWWESFGDETLDGLIELGIEGSHDLAAVVSRVEGADARAERAASVFYPTITVDSMLSGSPSSGLGVQVGGMPSGGGMPGTETEESTMPEVIYNGSAILNLRYQPDIWGAGRRSWRAARMAVDASEGDADAFAAGLTLQLAEAYFDAVMANQQIAIIERQIELNSSLLELRHEQSAASAAEVLQQRQQLASARARLPQARSIARMARERLAVLLSLRPSEAQTHFRGIRAALPDLPERPSTGTPRDLVENRPEIRAARARLAAAREQLRGAWLAAMPTLALSANAGGQLFVSDEASVQETWGFGINLSLPVFRGLVERAGVREARSEVNAANHTLESTILQAISDVEGALASEEEQLEQLEANREMLAAADLAFRVSRDGFVEGVGSYLAVLTALASLQQAELTLLGTHRALLSARLRVLDTLGGRWTRGLSRNSNATEVGE